MGGTKSVSRRAVNGRQRFTKTALTISVSAAFSPAPTAQRAAAFQLPMPECTRHWSRAAHRPTAHTRGTPRPPLVWQRPVCSRSQMNRAIDLPMRKIAPIPANGSTNDNRRCADTEHSRTPMMQFSTARGGLQGLNGLACLSDRVEVPRRTPRKRQPRF